jgi:hypothetical protein
MASIKQHLLALLGSLIVYFQPVYGVLLMVGFFVSMDTIAAMTAAFKNGEPITSRKFRAIFPKFIIYGVAVLVSHVIQRQFFPDFPATKIIAGYIVYSELLSIDENIEKITGQSMFRFFIKMLKK